MMTKKNIKDRILSIMDRILNIIDRILFVDDRMVYAEDRIVYAKDRSFSQDRILSRTVNFTIQDRILYYLLVT